MEPLTVRFPESVLAMIRSEAEQQGISAAQFIREAAFGRALFLMGRRGGPQAEAMSDLTDLARRLLEEDA